jgi:hypothetical protein
VHEHGLGFELRIGEDGLVQLDVIQHHGLLTEARGRPLALSRRVAGLGAGDLTSRLWAS